MKKYLLAAVGAAALATPAMARDGQGYVGVEAGVTFPRDSDANVDVDYTSTNASVITGGTVPANTPAGPGDTSFDDVISLDAKTGYNLGIYGGYDFGMFRVEGEIAWMHANLDDVTFDDGFIASLNTALNRPAGATPLPADPFVPGLPAISSSDINVDEAVGSLAFMLNGLLDFGDPDGFSFQGGFGVGWAKTKLIDEKDGSFAWQLILGAQYALSPNIDVGLRYKYFSTGTLDLSDSTGVAFAGNPNRLSVVPTGGTTAVLVDQTTNAVLFTDFESKVRTHNLALTLTYNFGAAAEPPPPPPPPPPPERG